MPNLNLRHNLPLFVALIAVVVSIPLTVFVVLTQKQDTRSKAYVPAESLIRLPITEFGTIIQLNGVGKTPNSSLGLTKIKSKILGVATNLAYGHQAPQVVCPKYLMIENFCDGGTIDYNTGIYENGCPRPPRCITPPPSICPRDSLGNPVCPMFMPPPSDFCLEGEIVNQEKDMCGCPQPPICKMPPKPQPPTYALKTDDGRIYPLITFSETPPCSDPAGILCPAMPSAVIDVSPFLGKLVMIEGVLKKNWLCDNPDTPGVTEECQTPIPPPINATQSSDINMDSWWPLPNNTSLIVNTIHNTTNQGPTRFNGILTSAVGTYEGEHVFRLTPPNIVCVTTPCPRGPEDSAPVRAPVFVRSSFENLNKYVGQSLEVSGISYQVGVGDRFDRFIDIKKIVSQTQPTPTASITPRPTTTPTPTAAIPLKNPISWVTQTGSSLKADSFLIEVNGMKFYGKPDESRLLSLASDPGSENYTTIEATWVENRIPMRLFLYFNKTSAGFWRLFEVRTYDGSQNGEWINYTPKDAFGQDIMHEPGQTYTQDTLVLTSIPSSKITGKISFSRISIFPVMSNCHEGIQNWNFTNSCGVDSDGTQKYTTINYSCFGGKTGHITNPTCPVSSTLLDIAKQQCSGFRACITPTITPPPPTTTTIKQTYLYFSPDTLNVKPNVNFTLPVLLSTYSDANKVVSLEIEIAFDAKKLQAVAVVPDKTNFMEELSPATIDNTQGRIRFARGIGPNPAAAITGSGKQVATITFTAKSLPQPESTTINFAQNTRVSALNIETDVLAKAGSAIINLTKVFLQGDLDKSGAVDIFDYNILVFNYGLKGVKGFTPADIDEDGDVDIFDYNFLVSNYGKKGFAHSPSNP